MNKPFGLERFDRGDKDVFVSLPASNVSITIDWDDVDHFETAYLVRKMFAILNRYWDATEWSHMDEPPIPEIAEDEDYEKNNDNLWESRHEEAKSIMQSLVNVDDDDS